MGKKVIAWWALCGLFAITAIGNLLLLGLDRIGAALLCAVPCVWAGSRAHEAQKGDIRRDG